MGPGLKTCTSKRKNIDITQYDLLKLSAQPFQLFWKLMSEPRELLKGRVIYFLGRWDTRDPFYGVNCSKYIYNNKSLDEENKPLLFIQ